jgi:hypothetical protein
MNPKINMRCKILALLGVAASALFLTGCPRDAGQAQLAPEDTNVLGIYTNTPESYEASEPTTFLVKTDELYTRKNFSGDKRTYLWGLVTVEDY